jgi:hypothetical protein
MGRKKRAAQNKIIFFGITNESLLIFGVATSVTKIALIIKMLLKNLLCLTSMDKVYGRNL